VAISRAEEQLGRLRVRAGAGQAGQLIGWAAAWPDRTWAVENATGLGRLLAQQLVAAGERVLDIQPKLAARVRVLEAGDTNKNDRAPRGVLLYRPPSGQRPEEVSLDLMAYS
jgi:transposase